MGMRLWSRPQFPASTSETAQQRSLGLDVSGAEAPLCLALTRAIKEQCEVPKVHQVFHILQQVLLGTSRGQAWGR